MAVLKKMNDSSFLNIDLEIEDHRKGLVQEEDLKNNNKKKMTYEQESLIRPSLGRTMKMDTRLKSSFVFQIGLAGCT